MNTARFRACKCVGVIVTTLLAVFTGAVCAAHSNSLDGIWLPDNSRSQRAPSPLPLTEKGSAVVASWQAGRDPVLDDPGFYCQSPGMPSIALSGAGYPMEIVASAEQVLIMFEAHQQVRRVFLDSAHPNKLFPQRNGHTIGHWQGATLVADTAGIRPIAFGAIPHSDQIQVTERMQVIDAGSTLVNELTITDPVMYTSPIVIAQYFIRAPQGTAMLEYECSEAMWIEHQQSRGLAPFMPE